jgi:protein-L-isoaspartate O-methyltransferase
MGTLTRSFRLNALRAAVLGLAAARAETPAENDRIQSTLAVREGMRVADVGAGDGRHAMALALKVGGLGHVFATEVDEAELARVRARVAEAGLSNVTAVLGDQKTTGLSPECCEAILLRLVYHHFTDPPVMRRDLWRALRPGGRIAVIEVPPKPGWRRLAGVPDRGGHGIEARSLLAEMQGEGFVLVEHHETWPGEDGGYCLTFERPAAR